MEQIKPKGKGPEITPMVIADLKERTKEGIEKYGEPLKAHNGRSALQDLYEELLDAVQYIKQLMVEKEDEMVTVTHTHPISFALPNHNLRFIHEKEPVAHEAHRLVKGDRGDNYGHPFDDFGRTAGMLSSLLKDKLSQPLTQEDVAMIMICVKLSRERNRPKRDNVVDGIGYFITLDMVKEEREKRQSSV